MITEKEMICKMVRKSMILAAILFMVCFVYGNVNVSADLEPELEEGQRKAEITVISIIGNELTYMEVTDETEQDEAENDGDEQDTANGSGEMTDKENDGREMPDTENGGREIPDMENGGREMPDMVNGGREMPDMVNGGGEMPDMENGGREMPDRENGGGEMQDREQENMKNTQTVYLPVGITVHTDTEKDAGFSILKAGDHLEALFETDETGEEMIIEIWMLNE